MSNTLEVQVRQNPEGALELFYYNSNKWDYWLESFSFPEGHNEPSESYRLLDCKPVGKVDALAFVNRVQAYYNTLPEAVELVLKDRLTTPQLTP